MVIRLTLRQAMMTGKALGDGTVLFAKCIRFTAPRFEIENVDFRFADLDVLGGLHHTAVNTCVKPGPSSLTSQSWGDPDALIPSHQTHADAVDSLPPRRAWGLVAGHTGCPGNMP